MSIRRTALPFEGQFTQIPNAWLRDARLSRRARGLLAEIMSHQHGWVISVHSLWKAGTEGREAIRKAILELAEYGYLVREQDHGDRGRFGEMNYRLSSPETFTVAQKLGDGTKTGARSTVAQESATKNTIEEEHHLEGGADAPTPTPDEPEVFEIGGVRVTLLQPWCKRHAATEGSDQPCRACEAAYARWKRQQAQIDAAIAEDAAARTNVQHITSRQTKYDPEIYCSHLQRRGACDMCEQEGIA